VTLKQFGTVREGVRYRQRTGAYGFLIRDGKIACARVGYGEPYIYDLPGGGVDPGETPEIAVVREFIEETGLEVAVVTAAGQTAQYFVMEDGEPVNNLAHFYEVRLLAEAPERKVEPDHELVWLDPLEALLKLRHDGYAYALMKWLRACGGK
jgi:8-oxo-dGTP diphosphatase